MVGSRRSSRVGVLALVLLAIARAVPASGAAPTEYEVKAAYLYYLASYVEWPDDAFPSDSAPLVIGVLGEDPFGPILDNTLRDKTVRGRRLVVRRFPSLGSDLHCQVLFISSSEGRRLPDVLKSLQGTSILTVGEMEGFADRGGQIALRLEDSRVRFSINIEAAQRARLKVSAQLLKLAEPRAGGGRSTGSG